MFFPKYNYMQFIDEVEKTELFSTEALHNAKTATVDHATTNVCNFVTVLENSYNEAAHAWEHVKSKELIIEGKKLSFILSEMLGK